MGGGRLCASMRPRSLAAASLTALGRTCGARVLQVDPRALDKRLVDDVRAALLDRKVLVFDDVHDWTQSAMVDFFAHFAEPLPQAGRTHDAGKERPEVFEVSALPCVFAMPSRRYTVSG